MFAAVVGGGVVEEGGEEKGAGRERAMGRETNQEMSVRVGKEGRD